MVRAIVCDIEGTTTSLSFVHQVLFPISLQQMDRFIHDNWESNLIREELLALDKPSPEEASALLKSWIQTDKKAPVLKSIQGKIWKQSFESGEIRGHVYPDVPVCFKKWKDAGIRTCIFSSGSIEAQTLIFRYSQAGDLTIYIDSYFDTTTGPKRDRASYRKIASAVDLSPREIPFLSDVTQELDAARMAGMQTMHVLREGAVQETQTPHSTATSLEEVRIQFTTSS